MVPPLLRESVCVPESACNALTSPPCCISACCAGLTTSLVVWSAKSSWVPAMRPAVAGPAPELIAALEISPPMLTSRVSTLSSVADESRPFSTKVSEPEGDSLIVTPLFVFSVALILLRTPLTPVPSTLAATPFKPNSPDPDNLMVSVAAKLPLFTTMMLSLTTEAVVGDPSAAAASVTSVLPVPRFSRVPRSPVTVTVPMELPAKPAPPITSVEVPFIARASTLIVSVVLTALICPPAAPSFTLTDCASRSAVETETLPCASSATTSPFSPVTLKLPGPRNCNAVPSGMLEASTAILLPADDPATVAPVAPGMTLISFGAGAIAAVTLVLPVTRLASSVASNPFTVKAPAPSSTMVSLMSSAPLFTVTAVVLLIVVRSSTPGLGS